MITYENVRVTFDEFVAIPELNLTINEGEFFTLLGPSGCGKTTALRTLAGFVQPASGRILIADRDVTRLSPDRRTVGMVFQNYALFPSMNVRDNIAFGLKVKRRPKAEIADLVAAIAARVRLTDEQLVKSVTALSGGQQQRVAIARALVTQPKILLLDEPLSNLDAKLRQELRGQLKGLQEEFGITTLYVTHDQEEALTMSDRIAVMNLGRVEQVGTPEEIYHRSATEFVCTFIGDVNRLSTALVERLRGAGASQLDPAKSTYLRIEKARVVSPGATHTGVRVGAKVVARSFHGLYTSYRVAVGDELLKIAVTQGDGSSFSPGDAIDLAIDPDDLLQYEATS
jgi:iron(III) transport system ATP-binding protein